MNTKTLIVHPKDNTTTFLNGVYANIADKTVVQSGVTKKELIELMKNHDRIMMMGHGSPEGLFAVGQFIDKPLYIIDHEMASILEQKRDNIFIWCYASSFMKSTQLAGFGTGMFISEVIEAYSCGLNDFEDKHVDDSNLLFVNEISKLIDMDSAGIYQNIMGGVYKNLTEVNPVAKYNYERLHYSETVHM